MIFPSIIAGTFAFAQGQQLPLGLADLHVHMFADTSLGGRAFHGEPTGDAGDALEACGTMTGEDPPVDYANFHADLSPFKSATWLGKWVTRVGLAYDEYDDVQRHLPFGVAAAPRNEAPLPNWVGWPTPDSIMHQQVWTGWLRQSHEQPAMLWYLENHPGQTMQSAMRNFRANYDTNMQGASAAGYAGLNLAVVSLVATWHGCHVATSNERRKEIGGELRQQDAVRPILTAEERDLPDEQLACLEAPQVVQQYHRAVEWAEDNASWVTIVRTPAEAETTMRSGKLAIILSVESSDFFTSAVAADTISTADDVKNAIRTTLIRVPKVGSIQLVHQMDSPFFGAADIVASLRESEYTKFVHGDPDGSLKAPKAAFAGSLPGALAYARAAHQAALSLGSGQALDFALRGMNIQYDKHAPKGEWLDRERVKFNSWDTAMSTSWIWKNNLGGSPLGQLLVDVLVEQGILIDVAHLSEEGVRQVDTWLSGKPNLPIFASHMLPREALVVPRELSASDATRRIIAKRGGIAGVRTADDVLVTFDPSHTQNGTALKWYQDSLSGFDCEETTASVGKLLATGAASDNLAVAFGTDLNGFINHAGASGLLRPADGTKHPCALAHPSIGSEVEQRGLAHAGLLTPLAIELYAQTMTQANPDATAARELVSSLWLSAPRMVEIWARAVRHTQAPPVVGPIQQSVPPVADAMAATSNIFDSLFDASGNLEEVEVSGLRGGYAKQNLPRMRAIEATLPYFREVDFPAVVIPQLPSQVGFLIGSSSFTAQEPPIFKGRIDKGPKRFLYNECVGIHTDPDANKGAVDVSAIETACRSAVQRAWTTHAGKREGSTTERQLGGWFNREYPGNAGNFTTTTIDVFSGATIPSGAVSSELWGVAKEAWVVATKGGIDGYCFDDASFVANWTPTLYDIATVREGASVAQEPPGFLAYGWKMVAGNLDDPATLFQRNGETGFPTNGKGHGDACTCWLLARIQANPALSFGLTPFDSERIKMCGVP